MTSAGFTASGAPHHVQNLAPSSVFTPHFGQNISSLRSKPKPFGIFDYRENHCGCQRKKRSANISIRILTKRILRLANLPSTVRKKPVMRGWASLPVKGTQIFFSCTATMQSSMTTQHSPRRTKANRRNNRPMAGTIH